jgi:hypothetical protein
VLALATNFLAVQVVQLFQIQTRIQSVAFRPQHYSPLAAQATHHETLIFPLH